MKFAHISDIHIFLHKFHDLHTNVFEQIFKKLKEEKVDAIVLAGDLIDSKNNLSPESVMILGWLLKSLADIAKTYIILGNHDLNLKNLSRLDSLTPTIEALQNNNIIFLKDSQLYEINDKFVFNVYSVLDKDKWKFYDTKDKVNIALFHGTVSGAKTASGWILDGEIETDLLLKSDYGFCGDIHGYQIIANNERFRFSGSVLQFNYIEDLDKGFLIWNIKDKVNYTCKFIKLNNPLPHITINLDREANLIVDKEIPIGAKIRLLLDDNISYEALKGVIDTIKVKYKPFSVTHKNNFSLKEDLVSVGQKDFNIKNIRNLDFQEQLITNYLDRRAYNEEVIDAALQLNKKYIVPEEEIDRNVVWNIKSLEWDNLFNYGEGNKIDFAKLRGIVGIFGKSFFGKSSVISSICYTLYNSSAKNNRKNYNIINQNKDFCRAKAEISIGNNDYVIERASVKYEKKLKGSISEEAKTEVAFKVLDTNGNELPLEGAERNETDNIIRKYFGTIDDFKFTALASQFGFLTFLDEGSTKRKEILAKFMDLDFFEKKHKLLKEEYSIIRGYLKKEDNSDFDVELEKINDEIEKVKKDLIYEQNKTNKLKLKRDDYFVKLSVVLAELKQYEFVEKGKKLKKELESLESKIGIIDKKIENCNLEQEKCSNLLHEINEYLNKNDIKSYKKQKQEFEELVQLQKQLVKDSLLVKESSKVLITKTKLLQEIPCGDKFKGCKFIKDAFKAADGLEAKKEEYRTVQSRLEAIQNQVKDEKWAVVLDSYKKCEEYTNKKSKYEKESLENKEKCFELEKELYKLKNQKDVVYSSLKNVDNQIDTNKYSLLQEDKQKLSEQLDESEQFLKANEQEILNIHKKQGSLEGQLEDTKAKKEKVLAYRKEYSAYEALLSCFHADGIPYDIIIERLPYINNEINKLLLNVVDFNIFIETEGGRLNIYIKHPSFQPRTLDMGSGAERMIASLAIRVALMKVCSLPKPNFLILDEPALGIDGELIEGFSRMLTSLKEYFQFIIIISHNDTLKNIVDREIIITHNKEKYAYISQ